MTFIGKNNSILGELTLEITVNKKQEIKVVLCPEATTILLHTSLVPFTANRVKYGKRETICITFMAYDCYFIPGGNVAVQTTEKLHPVCFGKTVFEIRIGEAVIKNRRLCPVCNHLSLNVTKNEYNEETKITKYLTSCGRKGCDGKSEFF